MTTPSKATDGLRPTHTHFQGPGPSQNSGGNSSLVPGTGTTLAMVVHTPAPPEDREGVIVAVIQSIFPYLRNLYCVARVSRRLNTEVIHVAGERRSELVALFRGPGSFLLRRRTIGLEPPGPDQITRNPMLCNASFYGFVIERVMNSRRRWEVNYPALPFPVGTRIPLPQEIQSFDRVMLERENAQLVLIWETLSRIIVREHPNLDGMPPVGEKSPQKIWDWMEQHPRLCLGITLESLPLSSERLQALRTRLNAPIAAEERGDPAVPMRAREHPPLDNGDDFLLAMNHFWHVRDSYEGVVFHQGPVRRNRDGMDGQLFQASANATGVTSRNLTGVLPELADNGQSFVFARNNMDWLRQRMPADVSQPLPPASNPVVGQNAQFPAIARNNNDDDDWVNQWISRSFRSFGNAGAPREPQ